MLRSQNLLMLPSPSPKCYDYRLTTIPCIVSSFFKSTGTELLSTFTCELSQSHEVLATLVLGALLD